MHLRLNIARIAIEGYLRAAGVQIEQLVKIPCSEVGEVMKSGIEFAAHNKVKVV